MNHLISQEEVINILIKNWHSMSYGDDAMQKSIDDIKELSPVTLKRPTEQWLQLKETIEEIRENNRFEGDGVTEMYAFILNYMEILEREQDYRKEVGEYEVSNNDR